MGSMSQQLLLSHQKEQLPAGYAAVIGFLVICGTAYSMFGLIEIFAYGHIVELRDIMMWCCFNEGTYA
jgi:hypothetical protein